MLLTAASSAVAQDISINFGQGGAQGGGGLTERVIQLVAFLTVISLAPSILIMMTSFTRIVVVLSFLRSAIGIQQTPPNIVIVSLALFLSAFIMSPTLERSYNEALERQADPAVYNDHREAAARLRDRLTDVVTEPKDMPWGNRALLFRDPDGNLVNLFTPVTDAARAKFGVSR